MSPVDFWAQNKLELADGAVVVAGSRYSPAALSCYSAALYCPSPALKKQARTDSCSITASDWLASQIVAG